jgi:hypothetical protein
MVERERAAMRRKDANTPRRSRLLVLVDESNVGNSVRGDGSPAEEGHYKANVDVMMAIDAVELSLEMRP